jgi:hypothetical protein
LLPACVEDDTLQVDGDTQMTVVRALSIAAAPGMMIAFFLQLLYPPKPLQRPPWPVMEHHYFFVLFSFVVIGAVSIFEWEMLFPDRLDFLVLSPLSLKPLQMLAAKAMALSAFLGLFLFACNFFGIWMLPAIMPGRTSLPLMLTLYVGVLPPAIVGVIFMEMAMEKDLMKLLLVVLPTALAHGRLEL